jgi:hypothetical protein
MRLAVAEELSLDRELRLVCDLRQLPNDLVELGGRGCRGSRSPRCCLV